MFVKGKLLVFYSYTLLYISNKYRSKSSILEIKTKIQFGIRTVVATVPKTATVAFLMWQPTYEVFITGKVVIFLNPPPMAFAYSFHWKSENPKLFHHIKCISPQQPDPDIRSQHILIISTTFWNNTKIAICGEVGWLVLVFFTHRSRTGLVATVTAQ